MKMVKSLILGSAAGLVAMSGAQAADLPVKAKAVEYVRVCSLYGAGFFYIPGTDTCIKLGGYMRVSVVANSNGDFTPNTTSPGGLGDRFSNDYTWRSRFDMNMDTRTATEYGVVRTYSDVAFTWTDDSQTASGTAPLGSVYSQIGSTGFGQSNNGSSGAAYNGTVGVYYAYIQFAGFTIGKAVAPFSAPWSNYPGNNYDGLVGGGGTVTGVNQLTYTAQFGNGVSASLAAVDPTAYYQAGVLNFGVLGTANSTGVNDYSGNVVPDIQGNINITQAWGMFQFSAAAHDNNAAYYINSGAGNIVTGHPDDKWGYAVQAAVSINNIPTGPGDTINAEVVYTNGATRYNIQDLSSGVGAWSSFHGGGAPGTLGSIGIGVAPDAVFGFGGSEHLISTWGGRGAFNHNWDPYWSSSIYGAYAHVDYGSAGAAIFCASFVATNAGVTSCNPNYNIAQVGFITRWTPVKNLTFSAELTYNHLDQKNAGTITTSGSYGTGAYTIANQDTYTGLFRAQRNF